VESFESVRSCESIVPDHRPRVEAYSLRELADPQNAIDATEETYLRVEQAAVRRAGRVAASGDVSELARL
jgi:hypothetical protein